MAILMRVRWYLIVVFICISLIVMLQKLVVLWKLGHSITSTILHGAKQSQARADSMDRKIDSAFYGHL